MERKRIAVAYCTRCSVPHPLHTLHDEELPQPKPRTMPVQWWNDHGARCCCFACVMRRIGY